MKSLSERGQIISGLVAEVTFTVLPLFVVLIVLFHAEHSYRLFASPEWSFGAAILFGQALVKFMSGLARGGAAATGPVALVITLLIVFGLAPSLLILYMTLQASEEPTFPSRWLQFWQVMSFCSSVAMYLLLGTIGETWSKSQRIATK